MKINLKEMQAIELEMLIDLDLFCRKNNINYFIGCGTLCGAAVRKGFFPWDDDIDILMKRKDYEKFINSYTSCNYLLLTCKNKDYYYPYAKMINKNTYAYECKNNIENYGVFIDIFPIDGSKSNLYLFLLKPLKLLMMSKWGCYLDNKNIIIKIIYKLLSLITKPFSPNYFAKKLDNICKNVNINKCKKAGIICHHKNNREIMDKNIFDEKCLIEFEGHKFYAPKRYKKYLNNLYGDYTKDNERKSHNHLRAYWK